MNFKYDKDSLKEDLTIEQIYSLLTDLNAEPNIKYNPALCGLGSSAFARRYLRNLRRIAPLLDFFSRVT